MQYYTDEVVEKYADDPFGLLAETQNLVHQQLSHILEARLGNHHIDRLLDVAIGHGKSFIQADKHFDVTEFIGNDYSAGMLEEAKKNFPNFKAIHGDCVEIDKHIPAESVDVVYAHYVLSYVNAINLFKAIHHVLKPGGYLSLATSTWDNLRDAQEVFQKELPFLFNREKSIQRYKGKIPINGEHVQQMLRQCGFTNIAIDYVKTEMTFNHFDEFWAYFAEAGWHVQSARITGKLSLDKKIWRAGIKLLSLFTKSVRPPVTATTNLCVITAHK